MKKFKSIMAYVKEHKKGFLIGTGVSLVLGVAAALTASKGLKELPDDENSEEFTDVEVEEYSEVEEVTE